MVLYMSVHEINLTPNQKYITESNYGINLTLKSSLLIPPPFFSPSRTVEDHESGGI